MKKLILAMVLLFLIFPIQALAEIEYSPTELRLDLITTQTNGEVNFKNIGDTSTILTLSESESIRDFIEFEQNEFKLEKGEEKIIRFRVNFNENNAQGTIAIKEGTSVIGNINVFLRNIERQSNFSSELEEVAYDASIFGVGTAVLTLGNAMFKQWLIPEISSIFDFLFLRITLFVIASIVISVPTLIWIKPKSIKEILAIIILSIIAGFIISLIV